MRKALLFLLLIPAVALSQEFHRATRVIQNPNVADCAGYCFRGHLTATGTTYCAEATALFARMTTQPTDARKAVINTFITSLKTAGVWDKLEVLDIFAAENEQSSLLNWVSTSYNATNNSCTFTANSYYVGGTGKYINSNFTPSLGTKISLNNESAGVYIYETVTTTAAGAAFGVYAATAYTLFEDNYNGNGVKLYATNGEFAAGGTWQTTPMLTTLSRLSSSTHKIYFGNDSLSTNQVSIALPTLPIFVCSWNNGGISNGPNGGKISAFFVGSGLTRAEHLALETALETYLRAVGLTIP